jgi:hypothetical protein
VIPLLPLFVLDVGMVVVMVVIMVLCECHPRAEHGRDYGKCCELIKSLHGITSSGSDAGELSAGDGETMFFDPN